MKKATGTQFIIYPAYIAMADQEVEMALSPCQILNGQRVLRIPVGNFIKIMNCHYNTGTCKVETLYEQVKLATCCHEISRISIHIFDISETRWTGPKSITFNHKNFITQEKTTQNEPQCMKFEFY